jgi:hypothetical protein
MRLLNIDNNAKTVKGQKKGFMTAILYLAPANLSGREVCGGRSEACSRACLNLAGRGAFSNVQEARVRKTQFYFENRDFFMAMLVIEIKKFIKRARRKGLIPVVRLNGTSDIPWERIPVDGAACIMDLFPDIQFYDYTKLWNRFLKPLPANYHLTFSLAEDNDDQAAKVLAAGKNVAVVFRTSDFPPIFMGYQVTDGDENDLRFLDPQAHIVGLKAKGPAKKDTSGFVRECNWEIAA